MSQFKIVIAAILLSSCQNLQKQQEVQKPSTIEKKITFNCMVVNLKGEVLRRHPGTNCAYLDNGSTVVSYHSNTSFISGNGEIIWLKNINSHHKIGVLSNEKLFILNSSFHKYRGKWTRFDRISLYDNKGNELQYFDFFDNLEFFKKILPKKYLTAKGETYKALHEKQHLLNVYGSIHYVPAKVELSHANSIYVIPKNKTADKLPAFAEGNYIVNVLGLSLIIILDRDLKNILWWHEIQPTTPTQYVAVHDVQVTPDGELLLYNNNFSDKYSAIEILNPITNERRVLFKGTEEYYFKGDTQGSVQILEDGSLLILQVNRKFGNKAFYVKNNTVTQTFFPLRNGFSGLSFEGVQEVKLLDLSSYLKNNKALF